MQTQQTGTDLSILSDVLVIFYNLIRPIAEQDNDGMTYKRGRLGALKAFQHKVLQDHGLCGEGMESEFSLVAKKSRPGLVMEKHMGFFFFHRTLLLLYFGLVKVLENHM